MSVPSESPESHWRRVVRHMRQIKPTPPDKPLRSSTFGDREAFVQNLVCGMCPREAYVSAGFANSVRADGNALRLLRDPLVAARVEYLRREVNQHEGGEIWLRRQRTIAVLESMISADRAAMYDDDGALRSLAELTPEQRALIDAIRPTKSGKEALMPSRLAAIQALTKLEGLEAPERREIHVTHEQRYSDIELARWIAARLEDGAQLPALVDVTPKTDVPESE